VRRERVVELHQVVDEEGDVDETAVALPEVRGKSSPTRGVLEQLHDLVAAGERDDRVFAFSRPTMASSSGPSARSP